MTPPAADLAQVAQELFGLRIDASIRDRLSAFADLVAVWSERMNLISAHSLDEILYRHVLDSLAPVALIEGARLASDIGSGAGFPGIPLAVLLPATQVELVESRRKRASFLRHAVRTLRLQNVRVREARGEDWTPDARPDATIGRAIRFEVLAEVSRRVLPAGGTLVTMRKAGLPAAFAPGFEVERVVSYRLPSGERHEAVSLRKCST